MVGHLVWMPLEKECKPTPLAPRLPCVLLPAAGCVTAPLALPSSAWSLHLLALAWRNPSSDIEPAGACSLIVWAPSLTARHQRAQLTPTLATTQISHRSPIAQTRGNQREIDRMRAQKRRDAKGVTSKDKKEQDGLTPAQRKERDAKALQEKAARKAAEAAGKK